MRMRGGDVIGLLDDLKTERGVLIGLNWGVRLAWWCAQAYPRKVAALVALGVPFFLRGDPPVKAQKQQTQCNFSIIEYIQAPSVAEVEMGRDVRRMMTHFLATLYGASSPDLLRRLYLDIPAGSRLLDGMPEDQALPP